MTALLVFSKNFAMREAITSITSTNGKLFFFDNKLEFLVSTTILNNSYILIDTIGEENDNVRWLHCRLAARGRLRQTYFVVPEVMKNNIYVKSFHLVATLKDLKQLCDRATKYRAVGRSCALRDVLFQKLSTRLSDEHLSFLLKAYNKSTSQYHIRNKQDLNKCYYVRNRLALGNGVEMKQLILLLSSQRIICS